MKSLNQLLLDFEYEQNFKDDDFYVGKSNFYPFELINNWPKWEKNFLNISGEKFSGKTHLTNIFLKKFSGIRIESSLLNNEDFKKINEINTSIKLPLTISINSQDYKKIIYLEEALANIDLISDFYILKFNNKFTQYRVIYNGSPKTFLDDMNDKYFNLVMQNNVWRIR